MSKFINSSVNYSEINVLKKILKPLLEEYNKKVETHEDFMNSLHVAIPNNDNKYYLFILDKNEINENSKKIKILYFFSNEIEDDFYIEFDDFENIFSKKYYIFEGFLYDNNHYYISDLLYFDTFTIIYEYKIRLKILNEILKSNLNINTHFNILLHNVFLFDDLLFELNDFSQLYDIFKNNFKFKEEISCIEIKNGFVKNQKFIINNDAIFKTEIKKIEKTELIDIYNVFDICSNNKQGILYIKTLNDSLKIRKLFETCNTLQFKCYYNNKFKKWSILL